MSVPPKGSASLRADWQPVEPVQQPSDRERRKAVAPSEMAGEKLFAQLLKKNSKTYVWRVHLRTPRHMSPRHPRLPAGFPELPTFWHRAASIRVFVIGFETFKTAYPADHWTQWTRLQDDEQTNPAQALRGAVLATRADQWTGVQWQIFGYTIDQAFWRRTPAASLGTRLRTRLLWHKARGVYRVLKYAKAWLAHHQERRVQATADSGRLSPSLLPRAKRVRSK